MASFLFGGQSQHLEHGSNSPVGMRSGFPQWSMEIFSAFSMTCLTPTSWDLFETQSWRLGFQRLGDSTLSGHPQLEVPNREEGINLEQENGGTLCPDLPLRTAQRADGQERGPGRHMSPIAFCSIERGECVQNFCLSARGHSGWLRFSKTTSFFTFQLQYLSYHTPPNPICLHHPRHSVL